jgi:hypothetical protein
MLRQLTQRPIHFGIQGRSHAVVLLILDESGILGPPASRDPSPKVFTIAQIIEH